MKRQRTANRTVEKISTYCLNYLVNGEIEGLTRQEVGDIDLWWKECGVEVVSPITDHQPYFSLYPLFGEPCEVEDCVVICKNII